MSATTWDEIEAPPPVGRPGRGFAALAPAAGVVIVALLAWRGQILLAVLLGLAVAAFLQARFVSPSFARAADERIARAAATFGRWVATGVSWLLLGLVFALLFVPVWLLAPLFWGRRRGPRGAWLGRATTERASSTRRSFGPEPSRREGSRAPVLVRLLAVIAVFVVLDLALGAFLLGTGILPGHRGDTGREIRAAIEGTMQSPAIVDEPWAYQFGQDMADFELAADQFVPFLIRGVHPFESPYLNTTDRERLSYEPAVPAGTRPLRVAFLGGSVMFGVGQRDEHTIPSEFARIAEEAGVAVEVHNYGFPGWVAWQEYQYLERLLARGEQYDLVIFYDGFNEFLVQRTDYSTDPTHLGTHLLADFADQYHQEHEAEPGYLDGLRDLGSTYADNSGIGRIIAQVRGDTGLPEVPHGNSEEQADAALDVYARASDRIRDLVEDHGATVSFFWQPQQAGWPSAITDRLPAEVHDLSGVFDGRQDEIYIDEVHTNEEGAHVAAQAIWDEVGGELSR